MAVIGSRANGTRVPQGGGFGPAQNSPQTAGFGAAAFQPASERRDVTYLGRPMLPTATGPAAGSGSASDNLADTGLPPLAPRSVLFVKSTVDRVRREWFDTVAQEERELDPVAATGFAGGIKQRFGDFTAKTLADMPDALRPHIAGGLERVGREIETRAADFEDVAGNVGGFNLTKQALDDISATVAHDRFAAPGLMAEGLKRIADAPLTGGAREILKTYYMGDLPVKTVLSHIDDDPDDALVALKAAGAGSARATGGRPDLAATQDPAGTKAPASDGLGDRGAGVAVASSSSAASAASGVTGSDGAGAEDGRFEPAVFYANIDQEVRGGLAAKAQVTSLRRRESARASTTKNLEQGIAANTVTPAQIEASNLEPDDKERLQAQLKDTRAREQSDAEAAERYLTNPQSFDPNNPQDRAMADQGFGALAGETDDPASALSVSPDGEAIDVIDLATRFAARSGFMTDAAIEPLQYIVRNGSPEDRQRAIEALEAANIPPVDDFAAAIPNESVASGNKADQLHAIVGASADQDDVADSSETRLGRLAEKAAMINRLFDGPFSNGRTLREALEKFEDFKSNKTAAFIRDNFPSLIETHRQVSEALDRIDLQLRGWGVEFMRLLRQRIERYETLTDLQKIQIDEILTAAETFGGPLLGLIIPSPKVKRRRSPDVGAPERAERIEKIEIPISDGDMSRSPLVDVMRENKADRLDVTGDGVIRPRNNRPPDARGAGEDELGFVGSGAPGSLSLQQFDAPDRLIKPHTLLASQSDVVVNATRLLVSDLIDAGAGAEEINTFLANTDAEIRRRSRVALLPLAAPVAVAAGVGVAALAAAIDHWRRNGGPEQASTAIRNAFDNARQNLESIQSDIFNADENVSDDSQKGKPTDSPDGRKAKDSSKNEKHGDGGRALAKAKKRIEELEEQARGVPRKQRGKLNQKMQNIRKTAQDKDKGTEHSQGSSGAKKK